MTDEKSKKLMSPQHSPIPWELEYGVSLRSAWAIVDKDLKPVVFLNGSKNIELDEKTNLVEEHLELIVRVVNSHDVAIKLMQAVLDAVEFDELVLIAAEFQEMDRELP